LCVKRRREIIGNPCREKEKKASLKYLDRGRQSIVKHEWRSITKICREKERKHWHNTCGDGERKNC
jgi:hypothetical protein